MKTTPPHAIALVVTITSCSIALAAAPPEWPPAQPANPLGPVYSVPAGTRDPFFPLPTKEVPEEDVAEPEASDATRAPETPPAVTEVPPEPAPVAAPPPELDQRQLNAVVTLNAVVATGKGAFGIVNGRTVRVGDVLTVQVDGDTFDLEITGLEAAPPKLLLKHNKNTFVCTLGSKGDQ